MKSRISQNYNTKSFNVPKRDSQELLSYLINYNLIHFIFLYRKFLINGKKLLYMYVPHNIITSAKPSSLRNLK